MILHEFLSKNENEVIQLCKGKVIADGESKPTSALLEQGLPIFYEELIGVLQRTASASGDGADNNSFSVTNRIKTGDAAEHGKESLRLGYTVSQVVHSYGAICQSIMEFIQTKSLSITAREFQDLNLSLDCAIAEAVTEFEKARNESISNNEIERLGFVMHEMSNSLASASMAHSMIQKGRVGNAGVTSEILGRSLARMEHLIGSSMAEIRLRGKAQVKFTQISLKEVLDEIKAAAMIAKKSKEVSLEIAADASIYFTADRHLLFSALSNLVNNAVKFTKKDGHVSVRGQEKQGRILIEVEDECGGLPDAKTEELFKPFVQKGVDKTGVGLGLTLSRRAIELNHGSLTARNIPGKGCIFTIDLPKNEPTA